MAIHGGLSPSPFFQPSNPLQRAFAVVYKYLALLCIVFFYYNNTTSTTRALGLVAACGFVAIETFWTTITVEDSATGLVSITSLSSLLTLQPGTIGHSSFAQFWVNVIFTPFLLNGYREFFDWFIGSYGIMLGPIPLVSVVRIIMFCCNVWLLEIVEGYLIMFLCGRNIAWEYRGADAWFHGNIKLQYAMPWMVLGFLVESFFEPFILPSAQYVVKSGVFPNVLMTVVFITAFFSPRLNGLSILKAVKGEKLD